MRPLHRIFAAVAALGLAGAALAADVVGTGVVKAIDTRAGALVIAHDPIPALGWPAMHVKLAGFDPSTAARLHPTDSQRIQRALEICRLSGRPMSELLAASDRQHPPYDLLSIGLLPSARTELHERIAHRFEAMLAAGLDDEVRSLRQKYTLHLNLPSMRCVGYRQTWEAQEGTIPKMELRDRGIFATRQLAKRQITWLTNSFTAENYDCLDPALADRVAAACP